MRDGQVYRFVMEGEPHLNGEPGKLKFRIRHRNTSHLLAHNCVLADLLI